MRDYKDSEIIIITSREKVQRCSAVGDKQMAKKKTENIKEQFIKMKKNVKSLCRGRVKCPSTTLLAPGLC